MLEEEWRLFFSSYGENQYISYNVIFIVKYNFRALIRLYNIRCAIAMKLYRLAQKLFNRMYTKIRKKFLYYLLNLQQFFEMIFSVFY
jgi:hypothetical protein